MPHPDDTIAAVSSAPGPGTRAIVRVSGPKAREVVGAVFEAAVTGPHPPSPSPAGGGGASHPLPPRGRGTGGGVSPRHLVPGSLRLSGVHSPLPADLYVFPGPRSYTGQDLCELHTIGSPPLVERLVADLLAAGARPANPGEFTLRAFLAGKLDLPRAEAVHAVIAAGTDADLRPALAQLAGGVSGPLHQVRDDLLNLLADTEAALDFADEDIEFVGKAEALTRLAAALARLANVRRQLDSRTVSGRPVRVALVGLPNAGKSSLFNALGGGPDALVSEKAGTTRDYLTKRFDLGGVPVELVDTAGWDEAADGIAGQAQRLGREQAGGADVVVWCAEPGVGFDPADEARLGETGAAVVKVRTKDDLASGPSAGVVAASVLTPGGANALRAALTAAVVSLARPPLAPSQSRCRHHLDACTRDLQEAHRQVLLDDPPELAAASLRAALDQLGELVGAVYTPDLLDRIFSRFCIGK
ncbi:MAG: 50S ribosome-binding GTPase [Gemmataceae bacterium]|nr:50S ribosome-binding GTPase [Gemmataceae bacterium]